MAPDTLDGPGAPCVSGVLPGTTAAAASTSGRIDRPERPMMFTMNAGRTPSSRTLPSMARNSARWLFTLLHLMMPLVSWGRPPTAELKVVESLDLSRYAGRWFEVARLPNAFQRQCVADTSATYTLRPDGKITVLNECRRADGHVDRITGVAKRSSPDQPNAKLRVTFFWPFYGNYWVIDLDHDYRWAVVGEPGRRYFWVLSRDPTIDGPTLDGIVARARAQGYDLSKLMIARGPVQRLSPP